jgi:hypothetical protein
MISAKLTMLTILTVGLLTGFTVAAVPPLLNYQGRLTDDAGSPIDTTVDLTFYLYGMPGGGDPVWTETYPSVVISDGLFAVQLGLYTPFADTVFNGFGRFLGVQIGDGPVGTPFIPIVSVAYALRSGASDTAAYAHAGPSSGATGWIDDGSIVRLTDDSDSVGIGTTLPQAKLHVEGNLYVTQGATFGQGNTNTGYQSLINGEGNTASGNYSAVIGGTNNEVGGDYAMVGSGRNNQAAGDYSAIAGGYGDTATGDFSFIAGNANKVSGNYSSIGGGYYNHVEGSYSSISGGGPSDLGNPTTRFNAIYDDFGFVGGGGGNYVGDDNGDPGSARFGVVAGGFENEAAAMYSSVGGGSTNSAGSYAATVGGGEINATTGNYATIAGGYSNQANGNYSTIAGGRGHTADQLYSAIGGGYDNNTTGPGSVISGGLQNYIAGAFASIGGGSSNLVQGDYSAVVGGYGDTIGHWADYSYLFGIQSVLTEDSTFMVDMPHIRFGDETTGYEFPTSAGAEGEVLTAGAGGQLSWSPPAAPDMKWAVTDTVLYTTGEWGLARGNADNSLTGSHPETFVNFGVACTTSATNFGYASVLSGYKNTATGDYALVAGGFNNTAGGEGAVVCGGVNSVAGSPYAVVCGGYLNTAEDISAIVGGTFNQATEDGSFVGCGGSNHAADTNSAVVGGANNSAEGWGSFIGTGSSNTAGGAYSCIPVGSVCRADGDFSLAFGRRAEALHHGAVVISADSTLDTSAIVSGCDRQMVLHAVDNFYLTDSRETAPCETGKFLNTSTGGYLSDAGDWTNASDRNAKENFRRLDGEALLERIAQLPIMAWNYKADDDDVRHIGPVAQDFHALFEVGAEETSISTIDPAGIALAAIKELHRKTQRIDEQQREIDELRSQLAEIKSTIAELAER